MFRVMGAILLWLVPSHRYDVCCVQVCNEMPGQEEDQDEGRGDVSFE